MQILDQFVGPGPDILPKLHEQISEAYNRLPEYWRNLLPVDYVILADEFDENREYDDITPDNSIIFNEIASDFLVDNDMRRCFIYAFFMWYFSANPQFEVVVKEQMRGANYCLVRNSSVATPAEFFRVAYAQFLFDPDGLEQGIREYLRRCEQIAQYGHLPM